MATGGAEMASPRGIVGRLRLRLRGRNAAAAPGRELLATPILERRAATRPFVARSGAVDARSHLGKTQEPFEGDALVSGHQDAELEPLQTAHVQGASVQSEAADPGQVLGRDGLERRSVVARTEQPRGR